MNFRGSLHYLLPFEMLRMKIDQNLVAEFELLSLFDSSSSQQGLKIHHDADEIRLNAAKRLFEKNLTTQVDGGYLTPLGAQAAEHTSSLATIMQISK